MKVDDTMLMALADGELPETVAAPLRARIAADPALQADYAVFEETARILQQDPGLGPVPEHLITAIRTAPGPDAGVSSARPRLVLWQPLALAASLVLAFWAGGQWSQPRGSDPLAHALLPTGETAELADGSQLRALASYPTEAGLCRLLRHDSDTTSEQLLICEESGSWGLQLALRSPAAAGYATASDAQVAIWEEYLDALGAGAPLTADEEAQQLRP